MATDRAATGRHRCNGSRRRATIRRQHAVHENRHLGSSSQGNNTLQDGDKLRYDAVTKYIRDRMSRRNQVVSATDIDNFLEAINDELHITLADPEIVDREVARLLEEKAKYHVPRIGDLPEQKPSGVFRFLACQFNNMAGSKTREKKVGVIKDLVNKYEINAVCGSEMGVNFSRFNPSNSFGSWFEGPRPVRSTTSHNVHVPSRSTHLAGGTGMAIFNELLQYAQHTCNDFRKLGRYCSWVFQVTPNHRFRLVVAYSTGTQRPKGVSTIYQQQLAYIRNKNLRVSPFILLKNDLRQVLKQWIQDGDRIALCVDCNEHILSGRLSKMLTEEVGLIERSHEWWQGDAPHTHLNGSSPIDGIFTTGDVDVSSLLMLSFHESPGDHRAFIFDLTSQSIFGENSYTIQRHSARKLTLKSPRAVKAYLSEMHKQFSIHRIEQRQLTLRILSTSCGIPLSPDLEHQWKVLHKQIDDITRHCESNCRPLQFPALPWSEPVAYWYDRKRAYEHLRLILCRGCTGNISNAIRTSKRHGIENPEDLTLQQVEEGIKYCQQRLRLLTTHASALRSVTQRNQLIAAEASGNAKKVVRLKQIAANESSKKRWRQITRSTKSSFAGAVTKTTQIKDGVLISNDNEASVLESLQEAVSERFLSAHSAPIHQTSFAELLSYPSDTTIPDLLLDNSFVLPNDLDESTKWIIEEIRQLRDRISPPSVSTLVYTEDDFRQQWSYKREQTSSSPSGIHIGVYKAALQDDSLVRFYSSYWTDIIRFKVPPERWFKGLQVALQKEKGNFNVDRLRFIQLYEADFNHLDNFLFGKNVQSS